MPQIIRPTIRSKLLVATVALVGSIWCLVGSARPAHADLISVFGDAYGGGLSAGVKDGQARSKPTFVYGAQVGARVLGLELYGDYQRPAGGGAVERAILGLRLGFAPIEPWRVEVRGGGGVIAEQGGALGSPVNRVGLVARAGANLERKMTTFVYLGVGLNAEIFTLAHGDTAQTVASTGWQSGKDIIADLHLKVDIGL
jgi:hypothetical protein